MKKNLALWPALMAVFIIFFLYSCRSEDLLSNNEEEYSSKFKVFSNQEKEKIDYGKGFKTLLERYDSIHNVQHTPKALKKAWKNSSAMSDEYIEFNIRSQDITTENKEVYTLFPLIRNHQVSGIIIAVLKNEDTYVEYLKMSPEAENYDTILELFRAQYIKSTLQNKNNTSKGSGGPCGFEGAPPCDIDTIIIIVPGGGSGGGGLPPGGGGGPSGGCGPYEDCIHKPDDGGGGGGETTPTNPTNQNPCDKTKSLVNDAKTKPAIDALKTKSTQGGENGYKIKADGTPSNEIPGGNHSVNFGDKTGYAGGYHNHTPTGIPMLSPPDVDQLLGFARAQGNYGDPTKAFVGMVAPNGMHYVIWFNGTYEDAVKTFSQEQLDEYTDRYQTRYGMYKPTSGEMSNEEIEKFFFRALIDMELDGKIKLQRVENDGTVKMIIKNTDGTTTATPCP
ncbi:hypothetical protein [Chryseobacterium contaminans]|nr:hypothetical protein [Chryseobacterium contaminans]SHL82883.1 hypothetical protein SAMN05444407_106273 [Chryseobacterium contaminans]